MEVIKLILPAAVPKPKPSGEEMTQDFSTRPAEKPSSAEKKTRTGSKSGGGKTTTTKKSWFGGVKDVAPVEDEKPPLSLRSILCDHADKAGMTALMWAASTGNLGVVAELLRYTTDDDEGEIK